MPAFAGISEGLIVVDLTTIMSDSDDIFIFNDPSDDIKSNWDNFWTQVAELCLFIFTYITVSLFIEDAQSFKSKSYILP